MSASSATQLRQATPAQVATVVRTFRKTCGWSQDTLATLARLQVRTIQRVERGERSSLDTKRAIAAAFGLDDLDTFSRLEGLSTPDETEERHKEFKRTHIVLDLVPADGRRIVNLLLEMSDYSAVGYQELSGMDGEAQDAFALVLDFVRDCMDVRDVASKSEMLGYGDELQSGVAALAKAGHSLFAARRRTAVAFSCSEQPDPPLTMEILYLVTAPVGADPDKVAVPRGMRSGI